PAAAVVMQRTDRFEAFPCADQGVVAEQVDKLKRVADLVIYCAAPLHEEERGEVAAAMLVTHGVELDRFRPAETPRAVPDDVKAIPGPRVGYVGSIDHHKFNVPLFLSVAEAMQDVSFVLVGGSSLGDDWCTLRNVHQLGRKPYEMSPSYLAAMDALILPASTNDWIAACNPIKLKEYLASGKPIVAADIPALDGWRDVISVADDANAFAHALNNAIAVPTRDRSERLASETWDAKAALILDAVKACARAKSAGCAREAA
ncbi:MAG: glycosyltransferase, partial [Pseudomonadota bacterium]